MLKESNHSASDTLGLDYSGTDINMMLKESNHSASDTLGLDYSGTDINIMLKESFSDKFQKCTLFSKVTEKLLSFMKTSAKKL